MSEQRTDTNEPSKVTRSTAPTITHSFPQQPSPSSHPSSFHHSTSLQEDGESTEMLSVNRSLISSTRVGYAVAAASSTRPISTLSSRVKALIRDGNYEPPKQFESSKDRELTSVFEQSWSSINKDEEGLRAMLVVTTATLLTINSPASFGILYRFASSNGSSPASLQDRVDRAGLMREAGLKCAVLVGAPRTINCLAALRASLEDDVKEKLDSVQSSREPLSQQQVINNGAHLFNSIYIPHTEKLLGKLKASHPDFGDFVIQHAYGGLLSNPPLHPTSQSIHHRPPVVTRTLTSALAIACLRAQGGVGPQLTSHVFGLLKAGEEMNANGDEGELEVEKWLATDEGVEWVVRSVDRVCEVVGKS
ncbi:hypothetical protein FRC03_004307 [Tulasnella sp. 419]|nr:hypothetical protein FRC03_004307 [Tulasnella sp. 419]